MRNFERNRSVKQVLDLGIANQLPGWMRNSGFDHQKYGDVWLWAMKKHIKGDPKDFIFPWIVNMRGEKYGEDIVTIGMNDNNALLWESVDAMCYPAVIAILQIPDLFSEEVFNMNIGTSPLNEYFYRGNTKFPYQATNFGAYVQLAMTKGRGDWRVLDALKEYYNKYKKNV